MRRCIALILAVLLVPLAGALAGGADDQYFDIYKMIRDADALNESGQTSQALVKYTDAQAALQKFQKAFPDWNSTAVNFRLGYLADRIANLSPKQPPPKAPSGTPAPSVTPTPVPVAPAAPADWENQLNALKEQVRQLQADKGLLEAKLKEALTMQTPAPDSRELAKAEERIKALQKENDLLSAGLERAKAKAASVTALAPAPAPATPVAGQIQQLEAQRDELAKKLDAANKALAARKGKASTAALQKEIDRLRARLDVLEAQKVPFTAEELALLKPSEPALAATNRVSRSVRELPAGLAALVSEAQRYFAARQYEKAEGLYLQVLREDEKNVSAMSDLALIEIKLNRYDQAEKYLKQALETAPEDPYCLLTLGRLRMLQQKPDDALDLLSHAARVDPQNAETQNFLGVCLSEKGQRAAAEAAFRRAILLQPNYGDAHNNLAYFYLIQKPPAVELGRFHYQKALAAGLPHHPEMEKLLEAKKPAGQP